MKKMLKTLKSVARIKKTLKKRFLHPWLRLLTHGRVVRLSLLGWLGHIARRYTCKQSPFSNRSTNLALRSLTGVTNDVAARREQAANEMNWGAFRTFYFFEILRKKDRCETQILLSISDILRESQRFSEK